MSPNLNEFIAIPISTQLYLALTKRFPDRVSSVVEDVLTDFLERSEVDFSIKPEAAGIYWEALFLPSGTEIRTKYFGSYLTAEIKGDAIWHKETRYSSMAQLANSMRGNTSNNAWLVLEIKRPVDRVWQPAQSIRR